MLTFREVVIIPTNVCDFRCRHCYVDGGDIYRFGESAITPVPQVDKYLRQIPRLKNVGKKVLFGGGEITLFRNECLEMVRCACAYGLGTSIVTNGGWAVNQRRANLLVKDMQAAGLGDLQLSISGFHREYCPVERIIYALRACKHYNMNVVLRVDVTKRATLAESLRGIPSSDLKRMLIKAKICNSLGRAQKMIPRGEFYYREPMNHSCFISLILTIRQDGSVFPCCGGSDLTRALCLGNANYESLSEIIARAERNPVFNILFHFGPKYVAQILCAVGGKDFTKRRYVKVCQLCHDLFIDDDVAAEIHRAVAKYFRSKRNAFARARHSNLCSPAVYSRESFIA